MQATVWPGRLELIPGHGRRADVLIDVGHNPAGAWALRAAVSHLDQGQPLTLVFGCLKDKPVTEMAQILFPLFGHIVVLPVDTPRSASVDDLLAAARGVGSDVEPAASGEAALQQAFAATPVHGLVVVDGIGLPSRAAAYLVDRHRACHAGGATESISGTPSLPALPLPARLANNLFRSPLFFLSTGLYGSCSLLVSCFERDGRIQHKIARQWARTLLRVIGAPVQVIGKEHMLPVAVYTSNHTSFMDTPLVLAAWPFQFRILAKQSLEVALHRVAFESVGSDTH